ECCRRSFALWAGWRQTPDARPRFVPRLNYLRPRLRYEFEMRIRYTRLHLFSGLPLHRPALVEHRAVAEFDGEALYVHCVVEHVPVARVRWRLVDMEDQPAVPGRDEPRGFVVVYRNQKLGSLVRLGGPDCRADEVLHVGDVLVA